MVESERGEVYRTAIVNAALAYRAYGWSIHPVPFRTKNPRRQGWQHEEYGDREAIEKAFTGNENIGVKLGQKSGGLGDGDLDHRLASLAAKELLPPTFVFGHASKPWSHWIYTIVDGPAKFPSFSYPGVQGKLVEPRCDGKDGRVLQTVFPPSIHESGEPVVVYDGREPTKLTAAEFDRFMRRVAAATLLAIYWPEGNRHDASGALGGWLLRAGWSADAVEAFLRAVAAAAGDGEIEDRLTFVRDTELRLKAGQDDVTGYPRLAELIGEDVVKCAGKWLGTRTEKRIALTSLEFTDEGNAIRLVARYGDVIRYCHDEGKWYIWDGMRWGKDRSGRIYELVRATNLAFVNEAMTLPSAQAAEALRWAGQSMMIARLHATADYAADVSPEIKVYVEDLDKDPYLLNFTNGTYDLRTNQLRDHDPADMITKVCGCAYDENAPFDAGRQFLIDVFGADFDLVAFIGRLYGLSACGASLEAVLPIQYGLGRNGKTTLNEVVAATLGDYAVKLPSDVFLASREDSHPTALRDLRGVRFAYASETELGKRLAEARVKELTGGDVITARAMREDYVRFQSTATLWLATNHRPSITGGDPAIWSRLKLIPFRYRFVDDPVEEFERPRVADMRERLMGELPGFAAWIVDGWKSYQEHGLAENDTVKQETSIYRDDEDLLGEWFGEACSTEAQKAVERKLLWLSYRTWCESNDVQPIKPKQFDTLLEGRGLTKRRGTANKMMFYGVVLHDTVVTSNGHGGGGDDVFNFGSWTPS